MKPGDLERLQRRLEAANRSEALSLGVLQEARKDLKKRFGCSSLKEARTLLRTKKEKLESLKVRLDLGLRKFEKRWKTRLTE